jgi:hypothetical protein
MLSADAGAGAISVKAAAAARIETGPANDCMGRGVLRGA